MSIKRRQIGIAAILTATVVVGSVAGAVFAQKVAKSRREARSQAIAKATAAANASAAALEARSMKLYGVPDPAMHVVKMMDDARAASRKAYEGTHVTPHVKGVKGGNAAIYGVIARAITKDPIPPHRAQRYAWINAKDNSLEIVGWNGFITSVTPDVNGALTTVEISPRVWSDRQSVTVIDMTEETYRLGNDGTLTFVGWAEPAKGGKALFYD